MIPAAYLLTLALFIVSADNQIVYNDPEVYMTPPEIIRRWEYPVEEHSVTTEDGYILDLYRIPYGRKDSAAGNKTRPVVLMQHGFEFDSANYVSNLPNNSAAFLFADAGFDVWLGNARGTRYGRKHVTLTSLLPAFWDYNIDHIAKYDLPAEVNYVLNATGQNGLYYMGHSQGTLSMFMSLSENEEMNKKVKRFFALAPVGTIKHIKGGLRVLKDVFGREIETLYRVFGSTEFVPTMEMMRILSAAVRGNVVGSPLCQNFFFLIIGPNSEQMNVTRTSVYFAHSMSGASTEQLTHWMQLVRSGKMQKFDFKSDKNVENYGQPTPPLYDITKITAPIYLYWGDEDYLATKEDIEEFLIPNLKTIQENKEFPRYNHMDFVFGLNATADIYLPIIDLLKTENGL